MFNPEEFKPMMAKSPVDDAIKMLEESKNAPDPMVAVSAVIDMLTKFMNGPTEAESEGVEIEIGQGAGKPSYVSDEIGQNPGSLARPEGEGDSGVPMSIKPLPKAPANAGNAKRLSDSVETSTYGGKITG